MVLLAGDLFHENKPSRKSLYQVMRSLRENCYSDKPCELELLSDAKDNFAGAFAHANYQDPDINVGIPVFSIHGNHDDPSGEGHLAALDVLQVAGLLNYYGRTPESDNIQVKPVLLQKGQTKLALYGLSNVRDQRLFRTFRDGKVRFFRPSESQDEWFNLISVHQNHHAYNETGYLPERFLPEFLDLVIWGHEHECLMTPRMNPERRFHVMQPGSSIATSLVPGEAAQKQVALLTITGRKFLVEPIPLKTVRPFIMREISLSEEKSLKRVARRDNNRTEVTKLLISIVDEMIEEANAEWMGMQRDEDLAGEGHPPLTPPLPLIRLRVEVSTPSGGAFDCENPQRFSNRFVGRVANVNDVVQFHRKKRAGQVAKASDLIEQPDAESISHLTALDSVKVEKLVREYLQAQSLTILPENTFSDAVSQFVDKDDKHAVEIFLNEALQSHSKHLLSLDAQGDIDANAGDVEEHLNISDDDTHLDGTSRVSVIEMELAKHRAQMEEQFARSDAAGVPRQEQSAASRRRYKPKPDGWDTDFDGVWEDQPGALLLSGDDSGNEPEAARALPPPTTRARGRGGRG
ncbi:meiotic recombination, partial [Ascosphaera acerosa]